MFATHTVQQSQTEALPFTRLRNWVVVQNYYTPSAFLVICRKTQISGRNRYAVPAHLCMRRGAPATGGQV